MVRAKNFTKNVCSDRQKSAVLMFTCIQSNSVVWDGLLNKHGIIKSKTTTIKFLVCQNYSLWDILVMILLYYINRVYEFSLEEFFLCFRYNASLIKLLQCPAVFPFALVAYLRNFELWCLGKIVPHALRSSHRKFFGNWCGWLFMKVENYNSSLLPAHDITKIRCCLVRFDSSKLTALMCATLTKTETVNFLWKRQ